MIDKKIDWKKVVVDVIGFSCILAPVIILTSHAIYVYIILQEEIMIANMSVFNEWIIEIPLMIYGMVWFVNRFLKLVVQEYIGKKEE